MHRKELLSPFQTRWRRRANTGFIKTLGNSDTSRSEMLILPLAPGGQIPRPSYDSLRESQSAKECSMQLHLETRHRKENYLHKKGIDRVSIMAGRRQARISFSLCFYHVITTKLLHYTLSCLNGSYAVSRPLCELCAPKLSISTPRCCAPHGRALLWPSSGWYPLAPGGAAE